MMNRRLIPLPGENAFLIFLPIYCKIRIKSGKPRKAGNWYMANYTIKAIMDTFEQMLAQMPFNKITVSALVERCGISSNTFYYHFRDIYDLLDTWLTAKEDQYAVHVDEDLSDWPELASRVMKLMQNNSRLVYHIAEAVPRERLENYVFGKVQNQFYEVAQKRVKGTAVSDDFIRSLGEFYCCTVFGYVQKFLWDHMETDVDEALERFKIFYKLIARMITEEADRVQANSREA